MEAAKLNVEFTRVTAPITGRMGRRLMDEGGLVIGGPMGATLLGTLVSQDPIYCYVDADELSSLKYRRLNREGKFQDAQEDTIPCEMGLANDEGWPHKGVFDFVDNKLNPGTGTIVARATFAESETGTRCAGAAARLFRASPRALGTASMKCSRSMRKPSARTRRRRSSSWSTRKTSCSRARSRSAPSINGMRVIRAGLSEKDNVIVNGQARVRPGMPVKPMTVEEAKTAAASAPKRQSPALRTHAMRFAHFFITRPIFAAVLSITLTIIGAISYFRLSVEQYPEVVPPTVIVTAHYPGANPEVVSETVANPIENEINGVENMLYMSSKCTTDGVCTTTVTFKIGTDLNIAQVQVQNRVAIAAAEAAGGRAPLGITTIKQSPNLTMVVHLSSPDDRYDNLYVGNYAFLNIKDQLARLPGVGSVMVFGARDYSMRIWLDPDKLAARNLTATRRGQRHPRAERAGRGRRARRAARARRHAVPAHRHHAGPPRGDGGV